MSFPTYSEYRASDAEWLGEVPSHWDTARLKTLLRETDERAGAGNTELLGLSKSLGVVRRSELEQGAAESDDYGKYKLVQPGQLVMNKMQAWNGVFGLSGVFGMVSPDYATFQVLRPELGAYLSVLFRTDIMAGVFFTRCRGMGTAFLRINTGDFLDVKVPLPSPSEVQNIAAFLDRETAKIDSLVDEQKRLIELLKEKRQAVISQAVTKGLDPTVPMKDSGVEWLGQVPAHWEVGPLKRFWSVTDCKHITADFVDDGIPLASIREVQGWTVSLDEAKRTTEAFYVQLIEGGRKPMAGDIVFTRNATVGEAALVPEDAPPFALGQDVCLLRRLDTAQSAPYMLRQLKSVAIGVQLDNIMIGSTFKRINVEEIRTLWVCVPPIDEQEQIATELESASAALDALVGEASSAVDLLQERRSALISAAVTGKIDVRGLLPQREAAPA